MLGKTADERQMTHMDHNNLNYITKTVNCLRHILYEVFNHDK